MFSSTPWTPPSRWAHFLALPSVTLCLAEQRQKSGELVDTGAGRSSTLDGVRASPSLESMDHQGTCIKRSFPRRTSSTLPTSRVSAVSSFALSRGNPYVGETDTLRDQKLRVVKYGHVGLSPGFCVCLFFYVACRSSKTLFISPVTASTGEAFSQRRVASGSRAIRARCWPLDSADKLSARSTPIGETSARVQSQKQHLRLVEPYS